MQKGETKPSSKRIEHKRNWDIEIPQLNHPADINIYIDVRRGRKIERLPLEAKIEVETVEQEDETMKSSQDKYTTSRALKRNVCITFGSRIARTLWPSFVLYQLLSFLQAKYRLSRIEL